MKTVASRAVVDLAERCLSQGLIDRYEVGRGVKLQICGNSVHLRPKQAKTVLETILKELGEGSPYWMPLKQEEAVKKPAPGEAGYSMSSRTRWSSG